MRVAEATAKCRKLRAISQPFEKLPRPGIRSSQSELEIPCCQLRSLFYSLAATHLSSRSHHRSKPGLLLRSEAEPDDAGSRDEVAERLFVRIRKHDSFEEGRGARHSYDCILHIRGLSQCLHSFGAPSFLHPATRFCPCKLDSNFWPGSFFKKGGGRGYV